MNISYDIIRQTKNTFEWTYYGDLYYFASFNHLVNPKAVNKIGNQAFFEDFLYEYRVSRNVSEKKKAWAIFTNSANQIFTPILVDELAKKYAQTNKNEKVKQLTSLSSKLAMLLHPDQIIPMDSINKIALMHNENQYVGFAEKVEAFKKGNNSEIKELIDMVSPRAKKIESIFSNELENLDKIRANRVVDKLLLQIGRTKLKAKELNELTK